MLYNHFEVHRGITTKTNLVKSLKQYYESNESAVAAGYTVFDTHPTTYVVARAQDDREIANFFHRYRELANGGSRHERVPWKHCCENMWVVKPAALNQGQGIAVFSKLKDINEHIYKPGQKGEFWVIQKYIEKPFLYKGRKFDIRIWALLTSDYRIYIYKDGYVRTSSSDYDLNTND